jgi:hypothetical protein
LGDLSIDRDQREKSEPGEPEQLPETKTKIRHRMESSREIRGWIRVEKAVIVRSACGDSENLVH